MSATWVDISSTVLVLVWLMVVADTVVEAWRRHAVPRNRQGWAEWLVVVFLMIEATRAFARSESRISDIDLQADPILLALDVAATVVVVGIWSLTRVRQE